MPLNILVLTDEIFPDAVGGVGKSLYNESAALSHRGHHITIFVRRIDPSLPEREIIDGMNVRRVQATTRTSPLYYFFPLIILAKMIRLLRAYHHPIDIIIVHNPIFLLAAQLVGFVHRYRTVYIFHSSTAQEIRLNLARGKYGTLTPLLQLGARGLHALERFTLRRVDVIVSRSRFMDEELHELMRGLRHRSCIIPIGVNTAHYHPLDQSAARAQLGLPAARSILFTTRRLVARMGLENLIHAVDSLRQSSHDVLLLIAGKGFLQPVLEALIDQLNLHDHVHLLGFVPEDQLPLYLASADLFVLPTEALEGFGLATIEALAVSLPVVGTPIGATPEILTAIHPRLVTAATTPSDLADTIRFWLTHDDQRADARQRARAAVETLYKDDLIAAQFERLFEELS